MVLSFSKKEESYADNSQPNIAVSLPFYSFNHRQTALMSMINELGLSTVQAIYLCKVLTDIQKDQTYFFPTLSIHCLSVLLFKHYVSNTRIPGQLLYTIG